MKTENSAENIQYSVVQGFFIFFHCCPIKTQASIGLRLRVQCYAVLWNNLRNSAD